MITFKRDTKGYETLQKDNLSKTEITGYEILQKDNLQKSKIESHSKRNGNL